MLNSTFNSQELFCFLQDYNLTDPLVDEWRSIQSAIKVWVDCWFGQEPRYEVRGDTELYVKVKLDSGDEILCILTFHARDEYPLEIKFYDEVSGEWEGDQYKFRFLTP